MKKITYECSNPSCEEPHTAMVMESLPSRPLSYAEINELPNTTPIEAAAGHDTFRIYTGDDEEYRDSHTDLMAIVYDGTGRVLRFIPSVGWAVEAAIEISPTDDPNAVVETLFDDYEAGVL